MRFQRLSDFLNAFRGARSFLLAFMLTCGLIYALVVDQVSAEGYALAIGAVAALLAGGKLASGKRAEWEGDGRRPPRISSVTGDVMVEDTTLDCTCSESENGRCDGTCDPE